jgi:hypothetical protein
VGKLESIFCFPSFPWPVFIRRAGSVCDGCSALEPLLFELDQTDVARVAYMRVWLYQSSQSRVHGFAPYAEVRLIPAAACNDRDYYAPEAVPPDSLESLEKVASPGAAE